MKNKEMIAITSDNISCWIMPTGEGQRIYNGEICDMTSRCLATIGKYIPISGFSYSSSRYGVNGSISYTVFDKSLEKIKNRDMLIISNDECGNMSIMCLRAMSTDPDTIEGGISIDDVTSTETCKYSTTKPILPWKPVIRHKETTDTKNLDIDVRSEYTDVNRQAGRTIDRLDMIIEAIHNAATLKPGDVIAIIGFCHSNLECMMSIFYGIALSIGFKKEDIIIFPKKKHILLRGVKYLFLSNKDTQEQRGYRISATYQSTST